MLPGASILGIFACAAIVLASQEGGLDESQPEYEFSQYAINIESIATVEPTATQTPVPTETPVPTATFKPTQTSTQRNAPTTNRSPLATPTRQAVTQQPQAQLSGDVCEGAVLYGLCKCESGGHQGFNTETGNGYSGAYQFSQTTWNTAVAAAGHPEYVGLRPASAPASIQNAAAIWLWNNSDPRTQWPTCHRKQ